MMNAFTVDHPDSGIDWSIPVCAGERKQERAIPPL